MKNYQGEGVWRDVSRWIRVGWMGLDLESGLKVLYSKTPRDSLANVPSRKGIMQSRPSDLIWMAENRSKGERGRMLAGIEREDGSAMVGPHRSFAKWHFRPRFAMGIARGEREQDCELTTEVSVSGGGTEEAQC